MPKTRPSHMFVDPITAKKKKRKPLGIYTEKEIEELEKFVLGGETKILNGSDDEDIEETIITDSVVSSNESTKKQPSWVDEDDVNITLKDAALKQGRKTKKLYGESQEYSSVLTSRFESVHCAPKWASLTLEGNNDPEILNRSGTLIKKADSLQSGEIECKKLTDLNKQTFSEGTIIKLIKFHPKSTVAMVGGLSGVVSLFQVDGTENPKLQSLKFERFPIHCGSFLNNGEEIIVGSQHHKFFYSHNLISGTTNKFINSEADEVTNMKNFSVSPNDKMIAVCGDSGFIYLLSARTKEYISTLKMNGDVCAIAFSQDSSRLFSHGNTGEVYIWDVNSRECIHKFIDDGCLEGTAITLSNNNQLLACGSNSGIVNIYETKEVMSNHAPKPLKIIDNLVTHITSLQFNSFSEILSISSSYKDNSIKLVHFPSLTIYKNFPFLNAKIYKPQCVDFSVNSGFFAVGNNRGNAFLYRLKHYGNY